MKLRQLLVLIIVVSVCTVSCGEGDTSALISTDSVIVAKGKSLFSANCASCHQLERNGIGPALGGVTQRVEVKWLEQFIRDPQRMINEKDPRADSLYSSFKSVMPSFSHWGDEDIAAVISYLHHERATAVVNFAERNGIKDPIPGKISLSDYVLTIERVAKFPATATHGDLPVTRITKVDQAPGGGALFVNDLRGQLYKLVNNQPVLYMDLAKERPRFIDKPGLATGFGSFTFHPEFTSNRLLYTTHTELPKSAKADFTFEDTLPVEVQWVLTEWKVSNTSSNQFSGTSRELLRIDMIAGAHGVQEIAFNSSVKKGDPDYGKLYIGVGDGASVQLGFPFVTHGRNRIWGSVLRIDPLGTNSDNKKYGVPSDNPFVRPTERKAVKEVYAYGFRNPHRFSWTSSGQLMVSNVGQANIESIYSITPGDDCGWPYREGRFSFDPYGDLNQVSALKAGDGADSIAYPLIQYDHDEGVAVCGGFEYDGKFLFGDIPSGRLFFFNLNRENTSPEIREWKVTLNEKQVKLKELCGSDRVDLHFGRDGSGSLYILTKADGMLYAIKKLKQ